MDVIDAEHQGPRSVGSHGCLRHLAGHRMMLMYLFMLPQCVNCLDLDLSL